MTLNRIRARLIRTKATADREWLIEADKVVRAAPDWKFFDGERGEILREIQKRFDASATFRSYAAA